MRTFIKTIVGQTLFLFILISLLVLGTVAITALSSDMEFVDLLLSATADGTDNTLSQLPAYDSLTGEEALQLRFDQLNGEQQEVVGAIE